MWENMQKKAECLKKELGINGRSANALVAADLDTPGEIVLKMQGDASRLMLVQGIGLNSAQNIAWGLWKNGYLTLNREKFAREATNG